MSSSLLQLGDIDSPYAQDDKLSVADTKAYENAVNSAEKDVIYNQENETYRTNLVEHPNFDFSERELNKEWARDRFNEARA